MARRRHAAGGVLIGVVNRVAGGQRLHKRHDTLASVMQITDGRIHIKLHGAPTPGPLMPVGAEDPLADCFRFGTDAFLSDEAVRNQLMRLFAMLTLCMI